MSSYGYWDEKNIQFSDKGFQVVLIADGGATHALRMGHVSMKSCFHFNYFGVLIHSIHFLPS